MIIILELYCRTVDYRTVTTTENFLYNIVLLKKKKHTLLKAILCRARKTECNKCRAFKFWYTKQYKYQIFNDQGNRQTNKQQQT